MKLQSVNSFSDGLVQDLNELVTPNKSLTNCLNGTLLTYNGNELSLQNDMGNVKVGTSYLPKGYVPVGMKEYGGVIYVASWNPETKRGQIGSFPSPQQLFGDDDTSLKEITIDLNNFLCEDDDMLYIKNEFTRQLIFQDSNDEYKIFHPGDKYIITSPTLDNLTRQLITDNVLKLRLAVVTKSGTIEYLDEEKLYKYDNELFIYETSETDTSQILAKLLEENKVHVFSGQNSGKLMFIVEYNTIKDFDVSRRYKMNDDESIDITFTGDIQLSDGLPTDTAKGMVCAINNANKTQEDQQFTYKHSKNSSIYDPFTYSIQPCTEYGILERLEKSGTIDLEKLIKSKSNLSSWQYYVGDTSLTIDWTFDYLDINNDTYVKSVSFNFIEVNKSNTDTDNISNFKNGDQINGVKTFNVTMDTYSGSFTTTIPFSTSDTQTNTLDKNKIYVCRMDVTDSENKKSYMFNFVYTGTYFNGRNIDAYRDNTISRPSILIQPEISYKETISEPEISYSLTGASNSYASDKPQYDNYIISHTDTTTNKKTYVQNVYKMQYDLSIDLPVLIEDDDNFQYNIQSAFAGELDNIALSITEASIQNTQGKEDSYDWSDYKYESNKFYVTSTHIRTVNAKFETSPRSTYIEDSIRMVPVCGDDTEPTNMFQWTGTGTGNTLECLGVYKHGINRVSWIEGYTQEFEESKIAGSPGNDTNINTAMYSLGRPTIAAFIGTHDDTASYKLHDWLYLYNFTTVNGGARDYYPYTLNNKNGYYWRSSREIAEEDGFMMISWRGTDDKYYRVNLGSNTNEAGDSDQIRRKSAHMIVKSILSQLLIARQVTAKVDFRCIDEATISESQKHSVNYEIKVNYTQSDVTDYADTWASQLNITNYCPKFESSSTKQYTFISSDIGGKINLQEVKDIYINAKYNVQDFGSIDYLINHDSSYKQYSREDLLHKIFRGSPVEGEYKATRKFIFNKPSSIANDYNYKVWIPYNTGICELQKGNFGQYIINGVAKDKLYMWHNVLPPDLSNAVIPSDYTSAFEIDINGTDEYHNDINVMFKTGYNSNLTDLKNNQVFLNDKVASFTYGGRWTKKDDCGAFSFSPYIYFGRYSIVKNCQYNPAESTETVPQGIIKLFTQS